MSNIDLKALRDAAKGTGKDDWNMSNAMARVTLKLLDRLESAERCAEEAGKNLDSAHLRADQAEKERGHYRHECADLGAALLAAEKERDALRKTGERYATMKRLLPEILALAAQGGANADDAVEVFLSADPEKLDSALDAAMAQEALTSNSVESHQIEGGAETASKPVHHGVDAGDQGGAGELAGRGAA